jgi:hypothetical protein
MALLPPKNLIQDAIESIDIINDKPRSYLGYSGMAHKCLRVHKYNLHWCYTSSHPARVDRLFRRGDYEETVVAKDLERIGVQFFDDQAEVSGGFGYAKGHIDGKVTNVPGYEDELMLLEIKTMNDKKFKEYFKKGLKEFNPIYYGQIMSYMGKLELSKCLYIATNKNDESRVYTIMDFDYEEYKRLERVAESVPLMDRLPDKIGGKTWIDCKYCNAKKICHYNGAVNKTCRSCENVTLEGDGVWSCGSSDSLDYDAQLSACDRYILSSLFE